MPYQSLKFLGYQQIAAGGLTSSTPLTLPVGAQQAQGSSCSLSGNLLTVGGTVTGSFAVGQVVQGTGIPANTYIIAPGSLANQWWLSNSCTTENGETVTGYADAGANVVFIAPEAAAVRYLPGGGTPTATSGMPISVGSQLAYDAGNLAGLRFIQQAAGAILNVLYYRAASVD